MKLISIGPLLFIAALAAASCGSPVFAQDDDPTAGLVEGRLIGDPDPVVPKLLQPQLVHHDRTIPVVIGTSTAILGGLSLVAGWSLYVARQNYRQRPWLSLSNVVVDGFVEQGAWSFGLGVAASSMLVTSEYFLMPGSIDVPTLAWFAGAGGLTLAAVGIGFMVGGQHCGPQVVRPGADLLLACDSGTADSLFGPLLMLTSAPLINLPLVYLLRRAFAGAPDSLSFDARSVRMRWRF